MRRPTEHKSIQRSFSGRERSPCSNSHVAPGSGPAPPIPWAPPSTAGASTSPCSAPTPRRSSSACSTPAASASSSGSCCPSTPTRSGTATCRTPARASSTATASTGPTTRRPGHRFNHHKLLLDPYAKQLVGQLHWSDAHFGYRVGGRREDLVFDTRDNARGMLKCRVVDTAFTWGDDKLLEPAVARERPLRDAPARLHHAASQRARPLARHLRRLLACRR